MAELNEIATKDQVQIRDDILRTIKNGLVKQGVEKPQVGPNSDWFITASALGNELAVVQANGIARGEQQMPDSAVDEFLARIAAIFDLEKQAAAGSVGGVDIVVSAVSPIVTGAQLTDEAGLRYEVVAGGNFDGTEPVTIRAVDPGFATNKAEGDVLRWVESPPFCDEQVTVSEGGLVNGIDAEDDEVLRSRVLAVFRNPPGAGNWEHVAEMAEESTPSAQKAFVYPAIQGPATVHVAVAAAPTETSKSRAVAATTISGIVDPFVKGKLPTHPYVVTTTVTDVNVDVAIGLSLPEAPTANPPGDGGGWVNGTPWPSVDGVSYFSAVVGLVASSTSFRVNAQTPPQAGVSRVAWLSPLDWKVKTALVTSYTGGAGSYVVKIDQPFAGIEIGSFVWPECENAQAYADAVLAAFKLMGPGEKSSNASALVRGFRHPPSSSSWPTSVGPSMLRAVTDVGDEVLEAIFLHRADGTTTKTGATGLLTPQVPGSVSEPPNQFIPKNIAFYRIA